MKSFPLLLVHTEIVLGIFENNIKLTLTNVKMNMTLETASCVFNIKIWRTIESKNRRR